MTTSRRSRRRLACAPAVLVLALALAGCGADGGGSDAGDATTTTVAKATTTTLVTTTTAGPTTTTTGPTTTLPPAPTTTTAPADGGGSGGGGGGGGSATPLTAEQAADKIRSTGDWAPDMGTYDPAAPLSAVEATIAGAGSAAAPEQLFFFAAGRYLGTATSTPRVAISIDTSTPGVVRATYGHFADSDPFCCPSLPPWLVTFRLDAGGTLVPQGELPPEDQFG